MNEADCTECQDTGTMYMSDDCYGECIHCDVYDKKKTIEEVRKERDYYYKKTDKLEEELNKLKEGIAKIALLANPLRQAYVPLPGGYVPLTEAMIRQAYVPLFLPESP